MAKWKLFIYGSEIKKHILAQVARERSVQTKKYCCILLAPKIQKQQSS